MDENLFNLIITRSDLKSKYNMSFFKAIRMEDIGI
jgi:hypothetical protein